MSVIIFSLLLLLSLTNPLHVPLTVVLMIVLVQQTVQLLLTWVHSTDVGFCCPGISLTRWFMYQDFYTKVRSHLNTSDTNCSTSSDDSVHRGEEVQEFSPG